MAEVIRRASVGMGEELDAYEVYETFKKLMNLNSNRSGWEEIQKRGKKGNAWWTDEVKDAIKMKSKACMRTFQRNMPEEVKERRMREYKACMKQSIGQ